MISGTQLPNGEVILEWEIKMRSDAAQAIEDRAKEAARPEKEATRDENAEAADPEDTDDNNTMVKLGASASSVGV